jgi:hypothetical protein
MISVCVETLEEALAKHAKPEIFNIDQGSQFTGAAFHRPVAAAYGKDGQNSPYTMVHFVIRTDSEVEDALLSAAKSLIADVRSRHPGEELRCPYMRALDGAVSAAV